MSELQLTLDLTAPFARHSFDGATYSPALDCDRLSTQLGRVRNLMSDSQWRTLAQIQSVCGGTEAACSARLRDLRKPRFGGLTVEHRRVKESGLWEYKMLGSSAMLALLGQTALELEREVE